MNKGQTDVANKTADPVEKDKTVVGHGVSSRGTLLF